MYTQHILLMAWLCCFKTWHHGAYWPPPTCTRRHHHNTSQSTGCCCAPWWGQRDRGVVAMMMACCVFRSARGTRSDAHSGTRGYGEAQDHREALHAAWSAPRGSEALNNVTDSWKVQGLTLDHLIPVALSLIQQNKNHVAPMGLVARATLPIAGPVGCPACSLLCCMAAHPSNKE